MIEFYIALAVAVILATLFVCLCNKDRPVLHTSLKGLASLGVLVLCLVTSLTGFNENSLLLTVGLLFCLLGDVLLALLEFKNTNLTNEIRVCGTSAFGIAQVFFCVLLAILSGCISLFGIIFGIVFACGIFFLQKPMKLDFGKLLIPSLIYGALLASNVCGSLIYMISSLNTSSILLFVGFLLFIISDLILSKIYYANNTSVVLKRLNYITYYGAIIVLACTFITL